MSTINLIKSKMQDLYQVNPNVHVSVNMTSPKTSLQNQPAVIKGVYKHIFQLEEKSTGHSKVHTLQYNDILTRHIVIDELEIKF